MAKDEVTVASVTYPRPHGQRTTVMMFGWPGMRPEEAHIVVRSKRYLHVGMAVLACRRARAASHFAQHQ